MRNDNCELVKSSNNNAIISLKSHDLAYDFNAFALICFVQFKRYFISYYDFLYILKAINGFWCLLWNLFLVHTSILIDFFLFFIWFWTKLINLRNRNSMQKFKIKKYICRITSNTIGNQFCWECKMSMISLSIFETQYEQIHSQLIVNKHFFSISAYRKNNWIVWLWHHKLLQIHDISLCFSLYFIAKLIRNCASNNPQL